MTDQLVLAGVAFLLTTVAGGLLGWFLQNRSWDHQNQARLREEELRRAAEVCHSISLLLDKRLYRMQRWYAALRAFDRDPASKERVDACLRDYNEVLYEWNDRLNVNLGLIGAYFGESARDWLDLEIYENFKRLGYELEDFHRYRMGSSEAAAPSADLDGDFRDLNDQVYKLGVFMMTNLREGHVGGSAPTRLESGDSPNSVPARRGLPTSR
jgi:hypothetical protein